MRRAQSVCMAALAAVTGVALGQTTYTVEVLEGPRPMGLGGINSFGEIAFDMATGVPGSLDAGLLVLEDRGALTAGFHSIGNLGVRDLARARAVNDSGWIAGISPSEDLDIRRNNTFHAVRWSIDGGLEDLGTLGGPASLANDMNDAGIVVGEADIRKVVRVRVNGQLEEIQVKKPAMWLADGTAVQFGGPNDFLGFFSDANAINNHNEIVGVEFTDEEAVAGNPITQLGFGYVFLPESAYGLPAGLTRFDDVSDVTLGEFTIPFEITDNGEIIGITLVNQVFGNITRLIGYASIWLPEPRFGLDAGLNILGSFGRNGELAGIPSGLSEMNNAGRAIGVVQVEGARLPVATVWDRGRWSKIDDLIEPAGRWQVLFLGGINDSGEIYASAFDQVTGTESGVILRPMTASCPADLNGDGVLDFFDVSEFLVLFAAGDLSVDFNGDGVLDFFDVSEFLVLFGAGCS